jgi:hypothetical protein
MLVGGALSGSQGPPRIDPARGSKQWPRKPGFTFALIVWAMTLAIVSLQPARPELFRVGLAHRTAHMLCFGMLSLLATAVFTRNKALPATAAACWLFGIGLEVAQHFKYHIPLEWGDIRDDGIGIGILIGLRMLTRRV